MKWWQTLVVGVVVAVCLHVLVVKVGGGRWADVLPPAAECAWVNYGSADWPKEKECWCLVGDAVLGKVVWRDGGGLYRAFYRQKFCGVGEFVTLEAAVLCVSREVRKGGR